MSTLLIAPTPIIDAVSTAASITSSPVHIMYSDLISIQLVWTGTTHGTFAAAVSNTAVLSSTGVISGGTWTNLDVTKYEVTGAYPAPAGGASNGIMQFINLGFAFFRIAFTRTDGTGLLTATLTAKPI
jgi:hypothetical protein